MIATATPDRSARRTRHRGQTRRGHRDPHPRRRLRTKLPTGEVGTIYVRNSTQFDGYTSGTTKDFHDGFMSSGDVGYLDDDGRLFVVGRDDEMIVSGGENVYPIEVEKTLVTHPDVAEAAVLGVDDEQYGQRLVAFVVLTAAPRRHRTSLKQHVRDNLANYKVPRDDHRARRAAPQQHRKDRCAVSLQDLAGGHDGDALNRRPLLRAVAELANAANAVRPLARKGYITMPVFAFGWPTSETSPLVLARLDARRGAPRPAAATSGPAAAGSRWCSRRSRGDCWCLIHRRNVRIAAVLRGSAARGTR